MKFAKFEGLVAAAISVDMISLPGKYGGMATGTAFMRYSGLEYRRIIREADSLRQKI